jgi:ABC-type oligopeptide transport system substrate-binding subunit
MQQLTEIPGVADNPTPRAIEIVRSLLRCGMVLAVIASAAACTGKQQNHESPSAQDHIDKSGHVRILRRGLPGEPRTLDPQLADDTFSFPVLRDLYEGLTAEDRNGRIVPGAAESWTVDKSGTVYTFLLRPNAKWSDGERTTAS